MLVCGLDIDHSGAASLVILEPDGGNIIHTSKLDPPVKATVTATWLLEIEREFPEPLWIAICDIKWHWLDTLGSLPVRWIHYATRVVREHMPDPSEYLEDDASRGAVALARALSHDLNDLRVYDQEMLYLSFIRNCAQTLTEILPRTQRFHPFLRSQLGSTTVQDDDDVPF